MPKPKHRVDTSSERQPLTSNPFAALASGETSETQKAAERQTDAERDAPAPFSVARTRKGGWPIALERRPGNKTVTLVRNVSGNVEALATLLRKRCGAGGSVKGDVVEVQGDHVDTIVALLGEVMD